MNTYTHFDLQIVRDGLSERLSIETIAWIHATNTSIVQCSKYKKRFFGEFRSTWNIVPNESDLCSSARCPGTWSRVVIDQTASLKRTALLERALSLCSIAFVEQVLEATKGGESCVDNMIYQPNHHQSPTMSSARKTSPRPQRRSLQASSAKCANAKAKRGGDRTGNEERCRGRCRVQWSEKHVKEGLVLVQEAQLARVVKTGPITEHYEIDPKPFAK